MFVIDNEMTIHITRGDAAIFSVGASKGEESYQFKPDDVVRLKVFAKKNCDDVVLKKDTVVTESANTARIILDSEDTKIGDVINKPVDYWYEIELNPDTLPQTIVGYDENGAKIFKLYPEGGETNE
jgi:hypothetical protein